MFAGLERKIRLIIILLIAFSVIVSSILLYLALYQTISHNFIQLSVQYARQQNLNANLYLTLIEETAKLLTNDDELVETLENPEFDSFLVNRTIDKLSGAQTANVSIAGITIYGLDGVYYRSKPIGLDPSSPPPLQQLMTDPQFYEFTLSEEPTLWWVRRHSPTEQMHEKFMTLALKIHNINQHLTGYLLVEIKIDSFLSFFNQQTTGKTAEVYVVTGDNETLPAPFNEKPTVGWTRELPRTTYENPADFHTVQDRRFLYVLFPVRHSRENVVKVISLTDTYFPLTGFLVLLILLNIALILPAVTLSKTIAKSISQPLSALLRKIQKKI